MPLNKDIFTHESDRAALQALQAIPGFAQLMKMYMNAWNEKLMYINNMASNIRISEEQLPQYYHMLLPVCRKLDIEVPDLFLELNVVPNSYTSGDTKPFIVLTSGLLETLPEELIPTVLAHECGHIVCHHVLYRTMGTLILSGALSLLPLKNIALAPINAALAYWMRCSEFSADRAAILCDGTADKMIDVCARFAGYDKDIPYPLNMEAFMDQAKEYEKLIGENSMNKTMEFMLYANRSHPINAVRAYEARKWAESDSFRKASEYARSYFEGSSVPDIPVPFGEKNLLGRPTQEVRKTLQDAGFTDVRFFRSTERSMFIINDTVTSVKINGKNTYREGDWVNKSDPVEVTYYLPLSNEEAELIHADDVRMPHGAEYYTGKPYQQVEQELRDAGFRYITLTGVQDPAGDGTVAEITAAGRNIRKGAWVNRNTEIRLTYRKKA
ncbi:MAG: PASTA domain-containing protein [Erysipelotrichaceae bacterium]|nr:PASTA domain-containing protein [Erysipelotrichaceae bacterium]